MVFFKLFLINKLIVINNNIEYFSRNKLLIINIFLLLYGIRNILLIFQLSNHIMLK